MLAVSKIRKICAPPAPRTATLVNAAGEDEKALKLHRIFVHSKPRSILGKAHLREPAARVTLERREVDNMTVDLELKSAQVGAGSLHCTALRKKGTLSSRPWRRHLDHPNHRQSDQWVQLSTWSRAVQAGDPGWA